ncbi:SUMF1/EgtB/PvdO family nonheme iron enzyme [Bacteroidales bacterium OttesenSCG-928-C19]|nr:SUMF1/EgtB/PvdO family nonheme iron enzyme [Bacteroidales bacterium OttesenSCG-928-C19]
MKNLALLATLALLLWSCGSKHKGELTGVQDRPTFEDIDLHGMVFIGQGSFKMGTGDQSFFKDMAASPKAIQVKSFWMDETEITNNEYRQFVHWVKDSITRKHLGEAGIEGYLIEEDEYGEPLDPPVINWKKKINYKGADEREAMEELYVSERDRFYQKKTFDVAKLNYEYYWMDYQAAAVKENSSSPVAQEYKGTMFANRPKGSGQFIRREVINVYPDTLCWIHDYAYSYNDDLAKNYFNAVAYDNYPVVGVSWKQAKAFCVWRTNYLNNYLESIEYATMNDFRLPTEAEWEYAARGGQESSMYPWGSPYVNNSYGCFLGNYKPQRGNYGSDGGSQTLVAGHYAPNDFGLYDMAGNVAEWCEDAFEEAINSVGHDLNQANIYNASDDDPESYKRKVIRGGSWKDSKHYIQVNARTYEYQDSGKSFVGFRCIQSYLGRDKADNLKSASNVY